MVNLHDSQIQFYCFLPEGQKSSLLLDTFLQLRIKGKLITDLNRVRRSIRTVIIEFFPADSQRTLRSKVFHRRIQFPNHIYIGIGPQIFDKELESLKKEGISEYYSYFTEPHFIIEQAKKLAENIKKQISYQNIVLNLETHQAEIDGKPLKVSEKEFQILVYLMSHTNLVVSSTDLLQEIWGYSLYTVTNTLRTHIAKLRKKLAEHKTEKVIHTYHKLGYMMGELPPGWK